jgi:hypothetical protein
VIPVLKASKLAVPVCTTDSPSSLARSSALPYFVLLEESKHFSRPPFCTELAGKSRPPPPFKLSNDFDGYGYDGSTGSKR